MQQELIEAAFYLMQKIKQKEKQNGNIEKIRATAACISEHLMSNGSRCTHTRTIKSNSHRYARTFAPIHRLVAISLTDRVWCFFSCCSSLLVGETVQFHTNATSRLDCRRLHWHNDRTLRAYEANNQTRKKKKKKQNKRNRQERRKHCRR